MARKKLTDEEEIERVKAMSEIENRLHEIGRAHV